MAVGRGAKNGENEGGASSTHSAKQDAQSRLARAPASGRDERGREGEAGDVRVCASASGSLVWWSFRLRSAKRTRH